MRRALIYIHSPSPPRDLRPWPERDRIPSGVLLSVLGHFYGLQTRRWTDGPLTHPPSSWVDQSTVTGLDCGPKVDVYINTVVGIEYIEMLTERQSSDRVDCILYSSGSTTR